MLRLFLLISLFLFSYSFAKVVESVGLACHWDLKQAKKEALENAKLNVVQTYVGTLISSKDLLINGELVRNIIQSRALGNVKLTEKPKILQKYFSSNDEVCVKLKAKFNIQNENIEPANFGLILLLNKKEFKPKEELQITISSKKPCYPYIFSVDAKQRVYMIFPNPIEDTFLLKGKYSIPSPKMKAKGFYLTIYPLPDLKLPQTEEIIFACTKVKTNLFKDFFASAFVEDQKKLQKLLNRPYTETIKIFNELLTQIGIENIDMTSDFYIINE